MNNLEREVRRLVRHLNDESRLRHLPLAQTLCTVYGTQSIKGAVQKVFDETFARHPEDNGSAVLAQVLSGNRGLLSERTYYRRRREALERVTTVILDRLQNHGSAGPPAARAVKLMAHSVLDHSHPESLDPKAYRGPERGRAFGALAVAAEMGGNPARADLLLSNAKEHVFDYRGFRDPISVFEVGQDAFFIAGCRSDLKAMRAAIQFMTPACQRLGTSALSTLALNCSGLYLYEGRYNDAASELNLAAIYRPWNDSWIRSRALMRSAQLALLSGNLHRAEDAARRAAAVGASHVDIAAGAAAVLARCAWRTGKEWTSAVAVDKSTYHGLYLQTLYARDLLRRGLYENAWEAAKSAYDAALAVGYMQLASSAAATLTGCLLAANPGDRGPWSLEPLRLHLTSRTRNAYQSEDLFLVPQPLAQLFRGMLYDDQTVSMLAQLYVQRHPDSTFSGDGELLFKILVSVLYPADSGKTTLDELRKEAAKEWSRRVVARKDIDKEMRRISVFTQRLSVVFPTDERSQFNRAARKRVTAMQHTLHQSLAQNRRQWLYASGF